MAATCSGKCGTVRDNCGTAVSCGTSQCTGTGEAGTFQGRLAAEKSFVGGDPCTDTQGHGTFIAGIIAANLDTQGIVGIAYTSQLLIAKVVQNDGTIPPSS